MNTLFEPTDTQIERIHARIDQTIARSNAPASQRRRTRRVVVRRSGFIAIGAGVATAALVLTGVIAPRTPSDTAQAAEILHSAAASTIRTSDPVVGAGQYLRITTDSVYTATVFNSSGPDTYYLSPTTGTLYIPSDRSQEWVWERHDLPITTVFGTPAQKAQVKLGARPVDPTTDGVFRAKAGAFYGGPAQDDHLSEQPRDPAALLAYFQKKASGKGSSLDEETWTLITDELNTGLVPAALRAALYQAAALIPGIEVIGSDVTLDGRKGEAIGLSNKNIREDIIVDPATGLLIGQRTVALKPSPGIPYGTSIAWTSVTTTVVNEAP